jgi:hypothetical protein
MAETALEKSIREAATAGISSHEVDGLKVQNMSIDDQIKADRYVKENAAVRRSTLPIRFAKVKPGGAV